MIRDDVHRIFKLWRVRMTKKTWAFWCYYFSRN